MACRARKPCVIGTTGWEADLSAARELVKSTGGAAIVAPNFAIGVQTLFHLVAECARTLDRLADFDVSISETHHRLKADSPSGTAKRLADILLRSVEGKTRMIDAAPQRALSPDEIHVSAQRVGANPGAHTVIFDLGEETIEICHAARSRAIFAAGALKAAEWIIGKEGFHQFEELIAPE
jgi:4-hydroxy-tetrahydrodipicolinate reductase